MSIVTITPDGLITPASSSGGPAEEGVSLTHSANQSVSGPGYSILTFNTENFDTDSMHEGVTNPTRITINTAGKYLLIGSVQWGADATGNLRDVTFYKNGTSNVGYNRYPNPSGQNWVVTTAMIHDCAVNDYFELRVYHDKSGSVNILTNSGISPRFEAWRIG